MYSQYIPHFPTLWLTKDERPLLYKYFILNPSLCRISSIVSSHLRILYIVPKSADLGAGHVLARSPAASVTTALLPGEPGDAPSGVSSAGRGLGHLPGRWPRSHKCIWGASREQQWQRHWKPPSLTPAPAPWGAHRRLCTPVPAFGPRPGWERE